MECSFLLCSDGARFVSGFSIPIYRDEVYLQSNAGVWCKSRSVSVRSVYELCMNVGLKDCF